MAYSAPRAWDGTETTTVPTELGKIRTNNDELYGRLPKINIGFYGAVIKSSGSGGQRVWYFQHRLRYLHYHFETGNDNVDEAFLYVTDDLNTLGTNRVSHGGTYSSNNILSSAGGDSGTAIDLNALTVGNYYWIVVQADGVGGESPGLFIHNLYESSES